MKNNTETTAPFGITSNGEFMYQEIKRNERISAASNRWGLLMAVDRFVAARGMMRHEQNKQENMIEPTRLNRARRAAAAVLQAEYRNTEGSAVSRAVEG
jgi:hypothetical protein